MNVEVVCFGILREHLPDDARGNRTHLDIPAGATPREVARVLHVSDRQVFAILVNGERAQPAQRLEEGDEVTLMPPFSGGT